VLGGAYNKGGHSQSGWGKAKESDGHLKVSAASAESEVRILQVDFHGGGDVGNALMNFPEFVTLREGAGEGGDHFLEAIEFDLKQVHVIEKDTTNIEFVVMHKSLSGVGKSAKLEK
jgi:hypothetical protein